MSLSFFDWTVIAAYFLFNLGIGIYYARKATGSTSEFFLSGRNVPWRLAGTSMVATTFAADTPLAVTGFVAKNGIAGNWLWWNFVMSGMLTVFLYARLWRRAGVMTDIEFAELRYSGKRGAIMIVIGMLIFTAFYTAISGLWGVLVTDLFQFALKMGMVIVLAILAVNAVGGIDGMKTKIGAMDAAAGAGSRLAFFPA